MQKFTTPSNGFDWEVSLTVGSMRTVKDLTGHDLGRPWHGTDPIGTRIVEDPVTLTEVVAALCHKQRPDVTMENWIKSVTPDAIPGMRAAFIAEYVDFFRRMSDLKTATMLESLMPAIERSRDRATSMLTSIAGGTPTSSPESSA